MCNERHGARGLGRQGDGHAGAGGRAATTGGATDAVEDVDGGRRERERRVQARVDYNPGGRRAGMRRGQKRWRAGETEEVRTGAKRKQTALTPAHVAVSPLTVTRMVGGRYDWLDGALAKRRRRLAPDDGRIHDPG